MRIYSNDIRRGNMGTHSIKIQASIRKHKDGKEYINRWTLRITTWKPTTGTDLEEAGETVERLTMRLLEVLKKLAEDCTC